MFRAIFSPTIRSTRLYLQYLVVFTHVPAGWCFGCVETESASQVIGTNPMYFSIDNTHLMYNATKTPATSQSQYNSVHICSLFPLAIPMMNKFCRNMQLTCNLNVLFCFLIGFILDFCVYLLCLLFRRINICTFNVRRLAPTNTTKVDVSGSLHRPSYIIAAGSTRHGSSSSGYAAVIFVLRCKVSRSEKPFKAFRSFPLMS
jgi:hypothetical protein